MRVALGHQPPARKAELGPPSTAYAQRVTHSESKGANTEQRETTSAINSHPVATSSRNPPVKAPPPLGDKNGHNFHVTLILL